MYAKSALIFGLVNMASAHMIINSPKPFPKVPNPTGGPDIAFNSGSNGPLRDDGSDFPCKRASGGDASQNTFEQGSTQTLSFTGSATHGGGSCQLSVTTDTAPTKNSVWKVIHSIEGGCPARNTAGNLPADSAEFADPDTYDFKIPSDLPAADYTFAWTWFNKIGNREMYMNCAPIKVTGSGGDAGFMDTLPDMFVANIGNGCGTTENYDVQFPNPGNDVAFENGATTAFTAPAGTCTGGAGNGGGNGGGNSPSASTPASAPTSAPVQSSSAAVKPTTTPGGGVFLPIPSSSGGAANPTTTAATSAATSAAPAPTPSSAPAPGNGNGSAFAAGTACTTEGEWNCIGGTSYQRCASGAWTAVQNLASGQSCSAGTGDLKVKAAGSKRSILRRALAMLA